MAGGGEHGRQPRDRSAGPCRAPRTRACDSVPVRKLQCPHRSYGHARARIGRVGGDRPEEDAWRHIGASAALLNDPVTREGAVVGARAVEAARLAVMLDDANAYAHYQLGRALGRQRAYPLAAAAFDAAIAREPRFAYAHYYAGFVTLPGGADRPDDGSVRQLLAGAGQLQPAGGLRDRIQVLDTGLVGVLSGDGQRLDSP